MSDAERIAALFAALGAADPQGYADSAIQENIAHLARFRSVRATQEDIDAWDGSAVRSLRGDPEAEIADAVGRCLDLGVSPDDLARLARLVAHETAFAVLYRLADPDGDGLPEDLRAQLPGWSLVETAPDGTVTGRTVDALHEDLLERDTRGTIACGWIWEANARAFCDSLAVEVGYDFDDSDWQAIETALPGTDDDQPPSSWYVYPFVGRDRVDVRVAQGVGGAEISVRIEGTVGTRTRHRIAAVLDLMSHYRVATE